nr:immunoglobulin heavy chain junction region [Macaca mulatta]
CACGIGYSLSDYW